MTIPYWSAAAVTSASHTEPPGCTTYWTGLQPVQPFYSTERIPFKHSMPFRSAAPARRVRDSSPVRRHFSNASALSISAMAARSFASISRMAATPPSRLASSESHATRGSSFPSKGGTKAENTFLTMVTSSS